GVERQLVAGHRLKDLDIDSHEAYLGDNLLPVYRYVEMLQAAPGTVRSTRGSLCAHGVARPGDYSSLFSSWPPGILRRPPLPVSASPPSRGSTSTSPARSTLRSTSSATAQRAGITSRSSTRALAWRRSSGRSAAASEPGRQGPLQGSSRSPSIRPADCTAFHK